MGLGDHASWTGDSSRPATRREFLAIGAGAVASVHGAGDHRRRPTRHRHKPAPHKPPLDQLEHVVFLIQENCSFDRYFGTLRGVRGFSDPHPLILPSGKPVFYQPTGVPDEYLLPWHYDTSTSDPCDIEVDNGWGPMHQALDGGKLDEWLSAEHELAFTMSYYTRADLPWHTALADAFTVCDGYYASALGPTNPNRLYAATGTIDPEGRGGGPVTDNSESKVYTWTTYPERLQARGISWRVYQQPDNFDDNALAWFKQYQQAQPGSPLYENGMRRRSATAFADDVAAGRLPQVSWIIAPTAQSEHPGYAPGPGADFCNGIVQALFAHPKVWANTVLFVTYDEPGGYFDHVLPPLPPGGTRDEFVQGEPIGLGYRVPTIVCSPWSRGGYVVSDTFDHTSMLRFLERRFGVREPQISAWRRKTCGDLVNTLALKHRDMSLPRLPATAPLAAASSKACSSYPPGVPNLVTQRMPAQEPGTRPRR
jgi:phospholipase C